MSAVTRRLLKPDQTVGGFDLSKVGVLPKRTLMPLRRNGLHPVPELGQARATGPVTPLPVPFGINVWLVTGYEAAKQVLADAEGFSTDFAHLAGNATGLFASPGGLGFADPPAHTRLRRMLTPEFTMRRLARLTPRIHDIIDSRLDAIAAADGPVDLVAEFALPIPSLVICELLGVPYADRADFQRLAMTRFDVFSGALQPLGAIKESLTYLRGVVGQQRRTPGDGLLGMIIQEHGDEVDDEELAGLADGVLTGGFETTASMLALGALVLLEDPQAFASVRDDQNAGLFVEEVLRHLAVVQVAFPRFARQDLNVMGTQIRKGDVIVVSLSGANRDPTLGANLEAIDPMREPVSHLAFGHGLHRCIGAELARMELRAAYPALVCRFPHLRLAVPAQDLAFRKASIVYGLESLPVHTGQQRTS
jgi:cytochrome P450